VNNCRKVHNEELLNYAGQPVLFMTSNEVIIGPNS
jgi:hypothetical protein